MPFCKKVLTDSGVTPFELVDSCKRRDAGVVSFSTIELLDDVIAQVRCHFMIFSRQQIVQSPTLKIKNFQI